ncbi:MAG: hypothetical protein E7267_03850 [Lachnospiraceae bacterium]|nr:hypothetical protein [Lachnospiraceae bacterium]
MSYLGNANAKCPYYHHESRKQITCEGCGCFEIVHKFKNEKEKMRFEIKNCYNYPNECQIARANDKKYE